MNRRVRLYERFLNHGKILISASLVKKIAEEIEF